MSSSIKRISPEKLGKVNRMLDKNLVDGKILMNAMTRIVIAKKLEKYKKNF